jgi:tRNA 2-thiocytidine biosynthesis protein TtcA
LLLTELEKDNPFVKKSLLNALANVKPRHLLTRSLMQHLF